MAYLYIWLIFAAGVFVGMCLNSFFIVGSRFDETFKDS